MSEFDRIETTVRGGFPVFVDVAIEPADPSAGLPESIIIIGLFNLRGEPMKWLEDRMTTKDWDDLGDELARIRELNDGVFA